MKWKHSYFWKNDNLLLNGILSLYQNFHANMTIKNKYNHSSTITQAIILRHVNISVRQDELCNRTIFANCSWEKFLSEVGVVWSLLLESIFKYRYQERKIIKISKKRRNNNKNYDRPFWADSLNRDPKHWHFWKVAISIGYIY